MLTYIKGGCIADVMLKKSGPLSYILEWIGCIVCDAEFL